MRYAIIRDDDTNALTPSGYLERLYRPFLDRGLPVNLATIPEVKTDVRYGPGEGTLEGFLVARNGERRSYLPIASSSSLVQYLRENPGYHIVQHGCHHEFVEGAPEFDHEDRADLARRLDQGRERLLEAGFPAPETFVAPYDRLTPTSWREVSKRFPVVSTGWFELGRLPVDWWPGYLWKKARRAPHWQVNGTALLSHPGCFLSYHRPYGSILDQIRRSVRERRLTVLVTHWWEFFRENKPDEKFLEVLHETAAFLASEPGLKVISFKEVAANRGLAV